MTYEFCLEYGAYPLIPIDALRDERQKIPDFIKDNSVLIAKIDKINKLFHELFLTIECQFHYIGSQYPDKISKIKSLYFEIIEELQSTYPEMDIKFEYFVL